MPKLRKLFRLLFAFLVIYLLWSIYVDICDLDKKIDSEALVPCLFYLPPLGFLAAGILLLKMIQSAIFLRWLKTIKERFNKHPK